MPSPFLRYVKLAMLLAALVCALPAAPAGAQITEEPEWEETPFQEALREGIYAFNDWELDKAEEELRRALTLVESEPEEQQPYALAYTRSYLSRVLDALHREEEALGVHELVMDTMLAPDSRLDEEDRADMLREHADLLLQLGRWEDAAEFIERSYEHASEWYEDENDPWALSYLRPMITVFNQTERQDEALELHQRIIDAYEESYGAGHPSMTRVLSEAGFEAGLAGEHQLALEWYEKLAALYENLYHEDSIERLGICYWIADHASSLGDTDRAIESYYKALEIMEKAYGDEDVNVADLCASIANEKACAGDLEGALKVIDEGLEITTASVADQGLRVDLLMYRAGLLRLLGRSDEADEALETLRGAIGD